jgi:hypothetical protein
VSDRADHVRRRDRHGAEGGPRDERDQQDGDEKRHHECRAAR